MYGSFMSPTSPKGLDNKRLQSFSSFSGSSPFNSQGGSSQNQGAFGSAMLPSYPQQELPEDAGLSYLVKLLRTNPAKLGL
tara:strand:+ start:306 stop:545 length:240 start_codon:yes stop_codon:yes gene_type:complete